MSDITISIPSEFLTLDYWKFLLPESKTQAGLYFLYISIAYGIIDHFWNLPSIITWNKKSKDERYVLNENYKGSTFYEQIPAHKIILVFVGFCLIGLSTKLLWAVSRLIYNCLLWPIFSILTAQKLPFMKSLKTATGRPSGCPPRRFVLRYG